MAAIIVEPIQAEGGDHYGSPAFFKQLQKIAADSGVVFIVDEVTRLHAFDNVYCFRRMGFD